jgi:hypothetical protein
MHHCCQDCRDGDVDRYSYGAIALFHQILYLIPSALLTSMITDSTMTVIGKAIVTLGIIPTTVPSFAMTLLRFSATQLGTEAAFLTVRTCHHLSLLSFNGL